MKAMTPLFVVFIATKLFFVSAAASPALTHTRIDTVIVLPHRVTLDAVTEENGETVRTYSGTIRYVFGSGNNDSLTIGLSFEPLGGGANVEVFELGGDAGVKRIMTGWNGPRYITFRSRIRGIPAPQYRAVVTVQATRSSTERRVDSLLTLMTLREKVDQLHGNAHKNTADLPRLGVPGFTMEDGPFGCQAGSNTLFPASIAQAQAWDTTLSRRIGEAMGREFRGRGKYVQLGPCINMCRHPVGGRNFESYGEDPYLTARIAVATVQGIQSAGTIASIKHFVCNDREHRRHYYSSNISQRTLREIYAYPFEYAVKQGMVMSVMSSYNRINGTYASENKPLLTDLLKDEWGFRGFEVSDWEGTKSTVASANAGHDVEMPQGPYFSDALLAAVNDGQVSVETLDDKVRRVLRTKIWSGVLDEPIVKFEESVNSAQHKALALECARKSIVLARNQGNILPLPKTIGSVALVGPCVDWVRGGGGGSSTVTPLHMVTPREGIGAKIGAAKITGNAASADAAIVFIAVARDQEYSDRCANNISQSHCSSDIRENSGFSGDQNELVRQVMAANPRTIVVYMGGSPCIPEEWADAPGVVLAYYPGQEQGHAIADVLFGDVNPSGKIVQTFPASAGQLLTPPFFDVIDDNIQYEPPEIGIGYRWFDHHEYTPLWPFGHGLSYTTFSYGNIAVSSPSIHAPDGLIVTATVTNTGSRSGDEVAQLYVSQTGATHRPKKELRGFCRVSLAPGESETVRFELAERDFAYWSETAGRWVVDNAAFRLMVGGSSGNLPLETTIQVQGM